MATGTVKWFNIRKGHDFIQPEAGTTGVFTHVLVAERRRDGRAARVVSRGCEGTGRRPLSAFSKEGA